MWFRSLVVPMALVLCLAAPAIARAQSLGTDPYQCANRIGGTTSPVNDCAGDAWVGGGLNRNNSLYREGDFVPFRTVITRLVAGRTYTLRIGYDAVQAGKHAYDYLGSVDAGAHPGQQIVPCSGVAETAGTYACGPGPQPGAPSTLQVPPDARTTFPAGSSQAEGEFSAWGARLTAAAYHYCAGPPACAPIDVNTTAGQVPREIDVTFVAGGSTAVLAWGGHIASVLDWGAGRTYVSSESGAAFHMRLKQIEAQGEPPQSTGQQELSLQAAAIAPRPVRFTTAVDRSSVAVGSAVVDTATLGAAEGARISGEVRFFVCFDATARPDCTTGGTQVGTVQTVLHPSETNPDGVASSAPFTPGAPGHYCFRAEFSPRGTGALYSPATHTNTTTECFEALPLPQLTVTKVCVPSTDEGRFNVLLDLVPVPNGADLPCGGTTGPFPTTEGTHTVSETAGTGTDLADYTSSVGGNCTPIPNSNPPAGTITIANGESRTCTITNRRAGTGTVTGTLTVNKVCEPPEDGGLFELTINSIRFPDVPCGGTTGPVELDAGPHTVGEAGGSRTSLANYTTVIGGDCAADGSVTVPPAGAATCTVTNTRIPAPRTTLTITKQCAPANGNGRFTITINGTRQGRIRCGGSIGPVDVTPGSITVGEAGGRGTYTVVWGDDCADDGTLVVGAGEQATCRITNIRRTKPPQKPALLTVAKLCVPSDDGGLFSLTVNGQVLGDQPCGDRFGPVVVSPGLQHVGEAAGTRTSLSDYTTSVGGDCAADGSVEIAAGRSATCTITNVRNDQNVPANTAQITIVKQCRPAGVTDRFELNFGQTVFAAMRCGDSTGPVVTGIGSQSVGEVAVDGLPGRFRTTVRGDCAPNGTITLTAGQHATCTVTNVRTPVRTPQPPPACYRLTVARRTVGLGRRVPVVARVRLGRRPIRGVRVYAAGPGVSAVRTTRRDGRARFVLRLRRPGILRLSIRKPFACPPQPPQKIGILGVSQPSLTG